MTVTPTLVYAGKESKSNPSMMQGEKVRGNYPVVSYANGGTVTIPANYDYEADMQSSDLYLDFNVKQGKKTYTLPRVKVAHSNRWSYPLHRIKKMIEGGQLLTDEKA